MSQLTFQPILRIIDSITVADPAVVTTTEPHGYHDGLYVRTVFPGNFGMNLLNGQQFLITVLSPTTFSLGVSTVGFDAFTSSLTPTQSAQAIPVAEVSSTLINAERNNLTPTGGF